MKICILGSSGYIGSFLSQFFKSKYSVICHARKSNFPINFKRKIIKFIYGDIRKKETIKKVLSTHPDFLIYTISYNHFKSEESFSRSIENNYYPLVEIINFIKKNNLKTKIIYFSTVQVYGRSYDKYLINENYPKNNKNIYSLTHSMCEDILKKEKMNVKSYILRLSNVFGMPVLKKINCWWYVANDLSRSAVLKNKIVLASDGSALRDFISLEAIGEFIDLLINYKKKKLQFFNLCSGKTYSIKKLAEKIRNNIFFKQKSKVKIFLKKINKKNKIKKFLYCTKKMKLIGYKNKKTIEIELYQFLKAINGSLN